LQYHSAGFRVFIRQDFGFSFSRILDFHSAGF